MNTNISPATGSVRKDQPHSDRHDRDEVNVNHEIVEIPNINRPAIDEPKTGDKDLADDHIITDDPSRQMQAGAFDEGSISDHGKANEAAESLHRETRKEELKVVRQTGSEFPRGAERIEERSMSANGQSAGEKQN